VNGPDVATVTAAGGDVARELLPHAANVSVAMAVATTAKTRNLRFTA
jgi:hypothetical protein